MTMCTMRHLPNVRHNRIEVKVNVVTGLLRCTKVHEALPVASGQDYSGDRK